MPEEAFAEACPVCRNNCNCKDCLRLNGPIRVGFYVFSTWFYFPFGCRNNCNCNGILSCHTVSYSLSLSLSLMKGFVLLIVCFWNLHAALEEFDIEI